LTKNLEGLISVNTKDLPMRLPRLLAAPLALLMLAWAPILHAGSLDSAQLLSQAEQAVASCAWEEAQQILEACANRVSPTRDGDLAVRVHLLLGEVFESRGNLEAALVVRGRALDAARLGKKVSALAVTLNETGRTAQALGHYERALRDLTEAERLFLRAGDLQGRARVLLNLGNLYFSAARYPRARHYYQQAGDLLFREPDSTQKTTLQAALLVNQGNLAWQDGHPAQAHRLYDQAQALAAAMPDSSLRGKLLLNLGGMLADQGNHDQALDLFEQAATAFAEADLVQGEMQAALQTAWLHLRLGGFEQALARMDDVERRLKSGQAQLPPTLRGPLGLNRALAYRMLDKPGQARRELQVLQGDQALRLSAPVLAAVQLQLGALACQDADFPAADEHYKVARTLLAPSADLTSQGWLGVGLGELHIKQGLLDEAEADFRQVLQAAQAPASPMPDLAWRASFGLGRLARARGDQPAALERYRHAVSLLEQIRGNLSTEELKTTFASDKHPVFEELIDLLLEMERPREAFQVSERARACALLEILRRGQVRVEAGEVPPCSLEEIQARLPADVTLLSYFVAQDKTWLWTISARSMTCRTLPVRRAWLTDVLGDGQRAGLLRLPAESDLGLAALEALPYRELEKLHEALVAPVEAELAPGTRVGIVPDGPLYYLPFSMLTTGPRQGLSPETLAAIRQQRTGRWLESAYLVERHPLFYAQSASLLASPMADGGLEEPPGANGSLVYAAPVTSGAQTETGRRRSVLRVAHDQFADLPGARAEGEAIRALDARNRLRAGPECRESTFFQDVASGRFQTIHLATHGFVDNRNPLLSGLVMCPEAPPYNGFVLARDVYRSRIQADLVVMSACRSGLGNLAGGEGIVGMTRAFQVSGVPRVMATLWSISDENTGPLMVAFHKELSGNGGSVAQALRNAQVKVLQQALAHPTESTLRQAHPYTWAPFVPTGADW
jgi:CHAT domain-containing protein/Tfp pilus assembly protein PilF